MKKEERIVLNFMDVQNAVLKVVSERIGEDVSKTAHIGFTFDDDGFNGAVVTIKVEKVKDEKIPIVY